MVGCSGFLNAINRSCLGRSFVTVVRKGFFSVFIQTVFGCGRRSLKAIVRSDWEEFSFTIFCGCCGRFLIVILRGEYGWTFVAIIFVGAVWNQKIQTLFCVINELLNIRKTIRFYTFRFIYLFNCVYKRLAILKIYNFFETVIKHVLNIKLW